MKANWDLFIHLWFIFFFATIGLSASSEKEIMDVFYVSKNIWIYLPTTCQEWCMSIHIYIYIYLNVCADNDQNIPSIKCCKTKKNLKLS